MRTLLKNKGFGLLLLLLLSQVYAAAQDPNFQIYLCLGQSNMEGASKAEHQDSLGISDRFTMMSTVDCAHRGRTTGHWYPALPPLARCYSGLSPADYFGRTMTEALPDSIRVGIINVAVGGSKIELFDEDQFSSYLPTTADWLQAIVKEYGGNPYRHLVEMGRLAQKDGVIKGILLHQGESNTGDSLWPEKVKKVYDRLLADLQLAPGSIPLLAGEVLGKDQQGVCARMNPIIRRLPQTLPQAHIISSAGCEGNEDHLHFSAVGYRKLGKRYAAVMLELMGIEITAE